MVRPTSLRATKCVAVAAALGAAIAMMPSAAMAGAGTDRVRVKVPDLTGPRGISASPARRLVYAEADGTISQTVLHGDGAGTTVLGTVPSQGLAPAVAQTATGAFILNPAGDEGADGSAILYTWSRSSGAITPLADIAAYQATDPDPYNQEGVDTETNPYGVAALPDGSALVSDAAGNDLLRVHPDGSIETVARLKPRIVLVPKELEGQPDVPPPGTPINAEGVATSVTVGADGAYYLGELRGFPATPGTSEIWRIEPDSVGAVCDPDAPDTGDCTRFADGLTSIVDLASGSDGAIYALSLCKQSWLQFELGIADPTGGLYRVSTPGAKPDLISANKLVLPGGVDVTKSGGIFIAGPVFDAGAIIRLNGKGA